MNRIGCFVVFSLALVGCGQRSGAGFALPQGDASRGKQAFAAHGCSGCHAVGGVTDLPPPTVQPPVPMIGGKTPNVPTDGELVTSIINPNHKVKRSFVVPATIDGTNTRMRDFNAELTVQDLIDIAAFLRSTYSRGVGL